MEKYKIEKGIQLPDRAFGFGQRKYPFAEMEPGDSFFVPCEDDKKKRTALRNSIMGSCRRKKGWGKFATRNVKGGIRVWRVE